MARKTDKPKKRCQRCGKEKRFEDFYISRSPLFQQDGRVPICKDCVFGLILDDENRIDPLKLNDVLRKIDKPYYKNLLESAYLQFETENPFVDKEDIPNHGDKILSFYFKNIAMRQNVNKGYGDSEKENFINQNTNLSNTDLDAISRKYPDILHKHEKAQNIVKKKEEPISSSTDDFQVTDEMVRLFGEGYTITEYRNMYYKYKNITENYSVQTTLHQEALATYVRFKVKEEMATAEGNVLDAQKWYTAAAKAAEDAKLTPKQMSKSDLQGGITSFSDIFQAVESANERIPIFPEFKYRPNDAVDFIIWCYINYERNLNGMPEVPYSDIYHFYDQKKQEYIDTYGDPYGIFTDDPTSENRSNVEKFITIPPEFQEE